MTFLLLKINMLHICYFKGGFQEKMETYKLGVNRIGAYPVAAQKLWTPWATSKAYICLSRQDRHWAGRTHLYHVADFSTQEWWAWHKGGVHTSSAVSWWKGAAKRQFSGSHKDLIQPEAPWHWSPRAVYEWPAKVYAITSCLRQSPAMCLNQLCNNR